MVLHKSVLLVLGQKKVNEWLHKKIRSQPCTSAKIRSMLNHIIKEPYFFITPKLRPGKFVRINLVFENPNLVMEVSYTE